MSIRRATRARGGTAGDVVDEVDMEGVENDAPTFSGGAEGVTPTPIGSAEGDKTHDGQHMTSAATAFPYEYIEGSDVAGS